MIKRLLGLFVFFVLISSAWGQGRMSKSELQLCVDPGQLTAHLIYGADSDMEKLETIFQWIIDNIQYDHKALSQDSQRINQNLEDVLRRKKALCVGYSELLVDMCTHAGIQAVEVSGYARELDKTNRFDAPDHSWNAVFIEKKWQLIDATWAAGLKKKSDAFKQKYQVNYYLVDPNIFILNHMPANPIWQLTGCPIPLEVFYTSTDSLETYIQSTVDCQKRDEIKPHFLLDEEERIYENRKAYYLFNPSPSNRKTFAASVLDRALKLRESGDNLFQEGKYEEAILIYHQALADISQEMIDGQDWHDWQLEGIALIYFHRGQIIYNGINSRQDLEYDEKMKGVLSNIQAAQWYAKKITPTIFNQGFLDQLEQTLEMIESQIK